MSRRARVGVVFGTRPEAIKMAPVVFELQKRSEEFEPVLISTAQHRQMLDQVLNVFGIRPDLDLDVMQPNQTLNTLTQRVLQGMDEILEAQKLDCLMVQGDTTTAFAAAVAAFYRRVPVAHVEAGLRTRDILNPYPEEVNRRLAAVVTEIHLAPTSLARTNLLNEGVAAEKICVTGNTVVDAAQILLDREAINHPLPEGVPDDGSRIVLVTSHRRESWGAELENICGAILELASSYDDVRVIYPVHLNPNVRNTVNAMLRDHPRIHLTAPLDYFQFLSLLRRSYLVLTDSGGVQEEAPFFGKPTIVLRKVTERPEAAMLGLSKIVGTAREAIVYEAGRVLGDPETYRRMAQGGNPYGDGRAAERIGAALSRWYSGNSPWLEVWEEFAGAAPAEVAAA